MITGRCKDYQPSSRREPIDTSFLEESTGLQDLAHNNTFKSIEEQMTETCKTDARIGREILRMNQTTTPRSDD